MPISDGAGVKLTRIIGAPMLDMLDPFLMLDCFESDDADDYVAGFPTHPHRGFETVTYLLNGRMRHKDNAGNEGVIEPGGVQWMTAGIGILHSEMPEQEEGLLKGFQLWVNLPANTNFEQAIATEHNAFITVIEGAVQVQDAIDSGNNTNNKVSAKNLAVLSKGDGVSIISGHTGARFLLIAGQPLQEPVARDGPFVMNTRAEVIQAFADFRKGSF